jgi:predicted short-subunit dehydrogenase-like oxidoreductase (DUF2520 family)
MILKIVMIGSGNLASHLSKAFYDKGHQICQVFSRNIAHAKILADQFDSEAISNLDHLIKFADLFVIAVSDNAIQNIINEVDFSNKSVIHTSGSIPISIFKNINGNYGVFYPFQTFTKGRDLDFRNIPICIEAINEPYKLFLNSLAGQLSTKIVNIDSEKRMMLHLSGIFANNFVNHLYALAEKLLKQAEIPFHILNELITETANKAIQTNPTHAQTGPAKRNDMEILKKHLDLLSSKPNFKQIYKLISNDIRLKYK